MPTVMRRKAYTIKLENRYITKALSTENLTQKAGSLTTATVSSKAATSSMDWKKGSIYTIKKETSLI